MSDQVWREDLFAVYKGAETRNKYLFGLKLDVELTLTSQITHRGKILTTRGNYGIKSQIFLPPSRSMKTK